MQEKKILLIITGGIAAYKMYQVVRDLVRSGAQVQIVLTPGARDFVSVLTLSTLSGRPVLSEFFTKEEVWNNHVDLALWADLIVVAPCTANTLSKMVHGQCDNLALAVYLSAKCPVLIAPAMDLDMYGHPSTKWNLEMAQEYGNVIIPAEYGELASGLVGEGRLASPQVILDYIEDYLLGVGSHFFKGKKILITAGPTFEPLDPVRFIGNHSSGKMGYALARRAAALGAQVTLVSGPTNLELTHPNIVVKKVTTAQQMLQETLLYYDEMDIAIASAAVADYRPETVSEEKIKKSEENLTISLVKNPDILKTWGERKKKQFLVGFALETTEEMHNAKVKLEKKNLDLIVLNSLKDSGAGFQHDTNKVTLITRTAVAEFSLKSKSEVAADIFDFIESHYIP
ncbi:bifunctional phosphopantothenoylcysteine decarboxylase/phosphopantothenate--cysteine ligase CoaBC [Planobacterium oryzisoli]|uniref:Coenzyme A biosynthesis bifunctional protein CoaBC n=1 Tax=Planobacterium oryzisoli TaxID=2771435 RepID=A0A930YWV7_9FLAO|nr:bifunctional phosphopantothenoylcysteine decarboxylase/phosphopantothenate--cysteine ligase CoaBC [Planobacterium oryzisoli]MBF5027826.1 bifunctional phosphopantothenoylcysteine decarboxylase/phosphopantothenate--cysteine ligase CoaBC [Planobacterium oryzisoli]